MSKSAKLIFFILIFLLIGSLGGGLYIVLEKQKVEEKSQEITELKQELKQENTEELKHAIEDIQEQEIDKKPTFFEKIRKKVGSVKLDQETFNEFFEELETLCKNSSIYFGVT